MEYAHNTQPRDHTIVNSKMEIKTYTFNVNCIYDYDLIVDVTNGEIMAIDSVPKVSILVPIYNVEKYLDQCLNSIVNQTMKHIEIICINDGSTDNSPKIIKKFADKDDRIKIINKKNTGYGHSMNLGLKAATGEYIGIVESDDFAEPDMFETLYNNAKKNDLDVSRSDFYYFDNNTKQNTKSDSSYVPHNVVICPSEETSVFYQQPSIWASIYERDFLIKNKIDFLETPGASYQDTSFTFKVYSSSKRFMISDKAFLHYRTFAGSSSFVGNSKLYCVCDEYEEIEKYLRNSNEFEKKKKIFFQLKFNAYRWNYYRLVEPYDAEFIKRWYSEFKKAYDCGDLELSYYNARDTYEINELLNTGTIQKFTPKVSVIVPVYNSEKFLEKCLDSLICQTLSDIEIICVNDGSTDSSRQILERYAESDKRIKIFDKKNGGLSSARNYGMKRATTKYIGFLDSDDWIVPRTYEMALKHIMDCDLVVYGTEVIGDYLLNKRESDQEYYSVKYSGKIELTDDICLNVDVSAWDKLYRRSIIEKNNIEFPEGKLYEDYCFYWKYTSCCKFAYFDKEKYHRYLRHENSIMAKTFDKSKKSIQHMEILDLIFTNYKNNLCFENHEKRNNSMFLNCFWFAYLNVPSNIKKKVLKYGTKLADKWDLTNDDVITALRKREYEKVDTRQTYKLKSRIFSSTRRFIENSTKCDFSGIINTAYHPEISPEYKGQVYTSAKWIADHENRYCIYRWNMAYSCFIEDEKFNWNYKNGITGLNKIENVTFDSVFQPGKMCRIYVSLFNCETACISGIIQDYGRSIFGTCISDGATPFTISVDINIYNNTVNVIALNLNNNKDMSSECRIQRIDVEA